jgi:hypothetical protein
MRIIVLIYLVEGENLGPLCCGIAHGKPLFIYRDFLSITSRYWRIFDSNEPINCCGLLSARLGLFLSFFVELPVLLLALP